MEKYKVSEYTCTQCATEFGIDKRFMLLWWKPLCHTKVVSRENKEPDHSYEILTFKTKKAALREIERLEKGIFPIQRRFFGNGKLLYESRYKPR